MTDMYVPIARWNVVE